MLNGLVYVTGLAMGGEWRSLLPRRTDLRDALKMFRYYTGVPLCQTHTPNLTAPALQHQIQRTSARRLFFRSGRRAPSGLHGLGDSQTHAALLVDCDLRRLWQGPHLALLAAVGFYSLCRTPCDSGSC